MKKLILIAAALCAGVAFAQTCLVPAPAAPPTPTALVINLPADAGSQGCTIYALVPSGQPPRTYPIGNAKCATVVAAAQQAAANDNGWSDGGAP